MIQASNLPCALCKILIEEKEHKNLIKETLKIISDIFEQRFIHNYVSLKWDFMDCFVQFGICEVLISYIGEYMNNDNDIIGEILEIIEELTSAQFTDDDTISRFIAAGLLNSLLSLYSLGDSFSWVFYLVIIVSNLCEFDVDFIHQFNLLGIPRDSFFFSKLPPEPEALA